MIILRKIFSDSLDDIVKQCNDGYWRILSPTTGNFWKETYSSRSEAIGAWKRAQGFKKSFAQQLMESTKIPNANNIVVNPGHNTSKKKLFSSREKVSEQDLELAKRNGVVQRKPSGDWGIISIQKREWWDASYSTREKAEAALRGYQANK